VLATAYVDDGSMKSSQSKRDLHTHRPDTILDMAVDQHAKASDSKPGATWQSRISIYVSGSSYEWFTELC
jgi:hypothetical protein